MRELGADSAAPLRQRYGMIWYGAPPTPWTAVVATRWWQLDRLETFHNSCAWRIMAMTKPPQAHNALPSALLFPLSSARLFPLSSARLFPLSSARLSRQCTPPSTYEFATRPSSPENCFKIAAFPGCVDKNAFDTGFSGRDPRTDNKWPIITRTSRGLEAEAPSRVSHGGLAHLAAQEDGHTHTRTTSRTSSSHSASS
jgi:hypothetical protein